jgi:hypothetical protein
MGNTLGFGVGVGLGLGLAVGAAALIQVRIHIGLNKVLPVFLISFRFRIAPYCNNLH